MYQISRSADILTRKSRSQFDVRFGEVTIHHEGKSRMGFDNQASAKGGFDDLLLLLMIVILIGLL